MSKPTIKKIDDYRVSDDQLYSDTPVRIQIAHDEGNKVSKRFQSEFSGIDGVHIIQLKKIEGGGDFGPVLMGHIFIGLSIFVGLATKSFFEELGKIAAQKLVKILSGQKDVSKLDIVGKAKADTLRELYILIPKQSSKEDIEHILQLANDLMLESRDNKIFVMYEKSGRRFIDISPSGWE